MIAMAIVWGLVYFFIGGSDDDDHDDWIWRMWI